MYIYWKNGQGKGGSNFSDSLESFDRSCCRSEIAFDRLAKKALTLEFIFPVWKCSRGESATQMGVHDDLIRLIWHGQTQVLQEIDGKGVDRKEKL